MHNNYIEASVNAAINEVFPSVYDIFKKEKFLELLEALHINRQPLSEIKIEDYLNYSEYTLNQDSIIIGPIYEPEIELKFIFGRSKLMIEIFINDVNSVTVNFSRYELTLDSLTFESYIDSAFTNNEYYELIDYKAKT